MHAGGGWTVELWRFRGNEDNGIFMLARCQDMSGSRPVLPHAHPSNLTQRNLASGTLTVSPPAPAGSVHKIISAGYQYLILFYLVPPGYFDRFDFTQ
jgi:hypothetical protein